MRSRSKKRITHLHASKRRSWEDKMVINKISILPTRMKLKELVLVAGTWLFWIFTIVILIVEGSADDSKYWASGQARTTVPDLRSPAP